MFEYRAHAFPYGQLLYFASAKEARGLPSERLTLPHECKTVLQLRQFLKSQYASLEPVLGRCALSLNEEMVLDNEEGDAQLSDNDAVALIPPVSGG